MEGLEEALDILEALCLKLIERKDWDLHKDAEKIKQLLTKDKDGEDK